MMKHTPGPWTSHFNKSTQSHPFIHAEREGTTFAIAEIYETTVRRERVNNARLMASAPDLYDAVLMLLGCTDLNVDELDETSIEAIEIARKALARAEGR